MPMSNENFQAVTLSAKRPWMKYYPQEFHNVPIPQSSLINYVKDNVKDFNIPTIHYYGGDLTFNDIFTKVDTIAKALKKLGCGEGDLIPVFLQAVPEFIILLLAVEKIGAALLCRDGTPEESVEAIKNSNSPILFAHDYLSKKEEEKFLAETQLKQIITVSPYTSADKSKMATHIINSIESRYPDMTACNPNNITWEQLLVLGESYSGSYEASSDPSRPLLCAYTSGSTGPSKQVIHSATNIIGIIHQAAVFTASIDFRLSWLVTCLPPALVAVTVSMILAPLCTNKLLILDPFCDVNDVDLEMMNYKPNCWALIPQFVDVLVSSTRIPDDFSIDFLYAVGSGAEALNNKQIRRMQKFLKDHNCNSFFSVGYGMSEGGSAFTMPCEAVSIEDCCCGMPMPATTLGIFEHGTQNEVEPGKIGEICKHGPGVMLSYHDEETNHKVLQLHNDNKIWVHTGDYGYMTEDGVLYVLGRGLLERFGGGYLFALPMENKIITLPGIEDGFFVIVPDKEKEGYFLPYLYLVLEKNIKLQDIEAAIYDTLEPHERPVRIKLISKRPYFHSKTNRIGLAKEILNE